MGTEQVHALAEIFAKVPDQRDPRGVRHPLAAVLGLVFLGLLGRIREFAVLARWAEAHWEQLREALGFEREKPPVGTTISRILAGCSLAQFQEAFNNWLKEVVLSDQPLTAAVDGKTACQGFDAAGQPVQMLTVFAHQLKLVLGQWSVTGEKSNEPKVLERRVRELLETFPALRLLTGDAIFAQRPLAEVLVSAQCDYLFQVKANQGDTLDALVACLGAAHHRPPAAETVEKRGDRWIAAGCGLI
jgi:DDE family transposase